MGSGHDNHPNREMCGLPPEPNGSDCVVCGGILTGRRKKYCSSSCSKLAGRTAHLLKIYGLTPEQWSAILDYQGGVCAICKRPPTGTRKLCVDHEHGGIVRGLICNYPCNLQLIRKHKTDVLLRSAADYLASPPAVEALGIAIVAPERPKRKRQPVRRRPRR